MKKEKLISLVVAILLAAGWYCYDYYTAKSTPDKEELGSVNNVKTEQKVKESITAEKQKLLSLKYTGDPYIQLDGNVSSFTDEELTTKNFIKLSELDELGRCGVAYACLSKEDMPSGKRGSIGMIKPSGWHTVRYDDVIKDRYLYNRCHLIAWSVSGLLADERNLITGTRYMNIEGMCDQEEIIRNYIKHTDNHVLYRVTPIFKDSELVARGVHMEAKSVEDNGKGVEFNTYAFNVQPKIKIDYATGESRKEK